MVQAHVIIMMDTFPYEHHGSQKVASPNQLAIQVNSLSWVPIHQPFL